MSKHNLLIKKVKKQILSINDLIESNFNKIKYFKSNYKKILLSKDNRVFLGLATVVILTLSYFLVPTFYSKDLIQSQFKNQIFKNYNINIKFNEKINYGLLPKPHFSAKNATIIREKKEIASINNLKMFIEINQFFSKDDIKIKDLIFKSADFNISLKDFLFFQELLKTEPHENKIFIKDSNIFFKNENDEVLFINKIKSSKFYYDSNNLQNVLQSKNEVFNVPYTLTVKNDKFNKYVSIRFNSKKIRLTVESKNSYDKKIKDGFLEMLFINKSTKLNYQLKKNSLTFLSKDNKNSYKGLIDFKPFYLTANFNYEGISSKNLLNKDSILIDLINSEILNNRNLSANINFNIKNITNINELNNLDLKTSIEEGNINFSNSTIMWKEDLEITFSESLLSVDDDGINLIGTMIINFKDIKNFYSSFQINKKNRKDIKTVAIDFIYNINSKSFRLNNPKVNNSQSLELEEFLDEFNSKDDRVFNKITFKNFINSFFKFYAG